MCVCVCVCVCVCCVCVCACVYTKSHFFFSEELMTRNANGKLQLHLDPASNKAMIVDNEIKSHPKLL